MLSWQCIFSHKVPSHTDQHGASDLTCAPRNYLQGKLQFEEPAAGESQLQTLIASSNYLTCEEPGLDNAALLGQGRFQGVLYSSLLQIQSGGWIMPIHNNFNHWGGQGYMQRLSSLLLTRARLLRLCLQWIMWFLCSPVTTSPLRIVLVIDGSTL